MNWVQFKWRNHDPQIGRFIEIDPLAEKYVYNSTYAFSENKVTSHVELEGLEAAALYLPDNVTSEQRDEVIRGYNTSFTRGAIGVAAAAAVVAAVVYPPSMQITGPFIAAEVFGVPSPNAPTSMVGTFASETKTVASSTTFLDESTTTIYRGVNEAHPGYSNAKTGTALPQGGTATASEHNLGNTQSEFTYGLPIKQ